jgi:2-isopropylmalate synthase
LSNPLTYEIIDPKVVGLPGSGIVLGKHSGRHALEAKLRELGYELPKVQLDEVFKRFKELADRKKHVTDADIESLVADTVHAVPADEVVYRLDYMHVVSGKGTVPTATVRIHMDGNELLASETGVGPIDAVYRTVAKLVREKHRLVDFQVRSVGPGTDAVADVVVRIEDEQGNVFVGHGISPDTIEAATKAYLQAINRLAYHHRRKLPAPQRGGEV